MNIYKDQSITIYFGDATTAVERSVLDGCGLSEQSKYSPELQSIKAQLALQELVFLKQIHSAQGVVVARNTKVTQKSSGDFLVTGEPQFGLGVYTADCLPIILHDTDNNILSICHAGWPGTAQNIVLQALRIMHEQFASAKNAIRVFFGPAAGVCCYEVSLDFKNNFKDLSYMQDTQEVFVERNGRWYFDLIACNKLQLMQGGIAPSAINSIYSACTICSIDYCSYRRQKEQAKRQITVAVMHI